MCFVLFGHNLRQGSGRAQGKEQEGRAEDAYEGGDDDDDDEDDDDDDNGEQDEEEGATGMHPRRDEAGGGHDFSDRATLELMVRASVCVCDFT